MAFPGKREGLAQKVDTAAKEAERLGLTTATLILRMARLEIDRAEPDEVESMPRNNWRGKPSATSADLAPHHAAWLRRFTACRSG